jgi:hypothetical protein
VETSAAQAAELCCFATDHGLAAGVVRSAEFDATVVIATPAA